MQWLWVQSFCPGFTCSTKLDKASVIKYTCVYMYALWSFGFSCLHYHFPVSFINIYPLRFCVTGLCISTQWLNSYCKRSATILILLFMINRVINSSFQLLRFRKFCVLSFCFLIILLTGTFRSWNTWLYCSGHVAEKMM